MRITYKFKIRIEINQPDYITRIIFYLMFTLFIMVLALPRESHFHASIELTNLLQIRKSRVSFLS